MKPLLISFSVINLLLGILHSTVLVDAGGSYPGWLVVFHIAAAGLNFFASGYCAASARGV